MPKFLNRGVQYLLQEPLTYSKLLANSRMNSVPLLPRVNLNFPSGDRYVMSIQPWKALKRSAMIFACCHKSYTYWATRPHASFEAILIHSSVHAAERKLGRWDLECVSPVQSRHEDWARHCFDWAITLCPHDGFLAWWFSACSGSLPHQIKQTCVQQCCMSSFLKLG